MAKKKKKAKFKYEPRSNDEIAAIARDFAAGHLFTTHHLGEHDGNMLQSVFMPLFFMDKHSLDWIRKNCGMIFEHISKAGPRAINGYPSFFSMQMLDKNDAQRVLSTAKRIREAVNSVVPAHPEPEKKK